MTDASIDERVILAIGRIEHALSRVEQAAIAPGAAAPVADGALVARHERLRATVQEAIARIDRVVDERED